MPPPPVVNSIGVNKSEKLANDLAELDRQLDWTDTDLTPDEQTELRDLLHKHRDVFALNDKELGCATAVKHKITLVRDAYPVSLRAYRTNPTQKKIFEDQVQDMLEAGVIEESRSAWAAPVVLVAKPGGQSPRFCVDYRRLNDLTVNDSYPMPLIAEALDTIGQSKPQYFSTLDLRSGFWQIAMDKESQEATAFTCSAGLYQFKKMPFGLKSAPATFQRLMSDVLRSMTWKSVLVYLDDLIVLSHTFSGHVRDLENVFVKLKQAQLHLKPQKCHFMKTSVRYLGHIVSKDGIIPDKAKCEAVQSFPRPHNVKTLRQFLGTVNFYRKFILNHAGIANPLHKLLKKDAPFEWTPACENAFHTLKTRLVTPPVLGYPQFDHPFKVATDASGESIGGILSQDQNGCERVIAYCGRSLNQQNAITPFRN